MIKLPNTINNSLHHRYKIAFIVFIVIGVYYPSLFSQFNSIDDSHIITYLENTVFSFKNVIIPGNSHYYRPVIWLTYFFDKYVWGLEPSFMHLENVILHAINSILVFITVEKVMGSEEKVLDLPFLSSLIFAVHPINTEAVCWIAGRTDPLATLFILLSAYYLFSYDSVDYLTKLFWPAVLIFIGCLAKEVAFFFFPVAALTSAYLFRCQLINQGKLIALKDLIRPFLPFVLFQLLYFYLRQFALSSSDHSVAILSSQQNSFFKYIVSALTAFGFYLKKMVIPYPLNFAITDYSRYYILLGILVTLAVAWMLWEKNKYYYILCSALILIIPAIIIAVKPIAWTPIAERYLYAPLAFFAPALVGVLYGFCSRKNYKKLQLALIAIIGVFVFLSVQRNIIWQDNFLLYKDTVAKSPNFSRVRNELGLAYALRGNNSEAYGQFSTSKNIDERYVPTILNLANVRFAEGRYNEALAILVEAERAKTISRRDLYRLKARIYEVKLLRDNSRSEQKSIIQKLIDCYVYLYNDALEPFVAYRCGQLLLMNGEGKRAAEMFLKAYNTSTDDAYYKSAAKKLADALSKSK